MARLMVCHVMLLVIFTLLAFGEAKTPPGIAKNPSHATCKDPQYKECHNLVHVCPKFCPDSCTVHCQSCKPICGADTSPSPPEIDPPPTVTPSPPVSTPPTPTPYSPPPTPPSPVIDPTPPAPTPPSPPPPTPPPPTESTPPAPTPSSPPTTSPSPPNESTPPTSSPPPATPSPPTESTPPTPTPSSPPTTSPSPPTESTPPTPTPSPPPPTTPSPPTESTPPTSSPSSPPSTTPSPPTPSSPAPPTWSTPPSQPKKVKCKNHNYPKCYAFEHVCPASCPGQCEVDCVTCKPVCNCDMPGAVCQDPRFIGGDGITFYFHGKKDKDFCLVADNNLHINGHFIGKRNKSMGRDFTWVQSIGVLFENHKVQITAQKTSTWDDTVDRISVTFDGENIFLPKTEGAKWQSSMTSITRIHDTNHILVKMGVLMPVMGGDNRFASTNSFSADCSVAKFKGSQEDGSSLNFQLPSLTCQSGLEGRGVVCKR
ncbi:hypothetical protein L2E82_25144 [Cichorium intybus]|uniref:Uncharacterized protein n=1 Tax=Cichorium intybus TaxID=13427 RepID=A0ACB9E271_CICIN|nr:hypothetical protein L2E82_25144 [Cichorium intybus]